MTLPILARWRLALFLAPFLAWLAPALAVADTPRLLIYSGITMVRPITELAQTFEQRENVKVSIAQGGSEDLYQGAKKSRQGDIYFPGEPSFLDKHKAEGLLGDATLAGYNQMALFVQKGNPKKVRPDLNELLRKDLIMIVGSPESGSVGQETRQMLEKAKLYASVMNRAAFLRPDSRSLNVSMKRGEADLTLNWRATALFPDNAPYLDIIDLDPRVAEPQALLLIQLTFSQQPQLARRFIDLVASPEGQAVFRKYGFLDNTARR